MVKTREKKKTTVSRSAEKTRRTVKSRQVLGFVNIPNLAKRFVTYDESKNGSIDET